MVMLVEPYLMFEGRTEEALEFYKSALGAEVKAMMRFKDVPGAKDHTPPGAENKVMHSLFKIGEATLMASDGFCSGKTDFKGISLALTARDDDEARRVFAALADGGNIKMPLTKTFFSSLYGLVSDRFGVDWMVVVTDSASASA
jgi:PhnB protein